MNPAAARARRSPSWAAPALLAALAGCAQGTLPSEVDPDSEAPFPEEDLPPPEDTWRPSLPDTGFPIDTAVEDTGVPPVDTAPHVDTAPPIDTRPLVDTGFPPVDVPPRVDTGPCGAAGLDCCPGTTCNAGLQCLFNTCVERPTCGGFGQPCCGVAACGPGLACSASRCTATTSCGASGQGCCASGTQCIAGLACMTSVCSPCGNAGQVCCVGTPNCFGTLRCGGTYCRR